MAIEEHDKLHSEPHEVDDNGDYATVQALADEFEYEEAIEACIDILERNFDDNEVHALLLNIFGELGSKNELVRDGRKRLHEILLRVEKDL